MTTTTDTTAALVRLRFGRDHTTLPQVISTLTTVDTLWLASYHLAVYEHGWLKGEEPVPSGRGITPGPLPIRPTVHLSLSSPFIVELTHGAVVSGVGLLVLRSTWGMFKWTVTHAEDVGATLGRMVLGWRESWSAAERARHGDALDDLPPYAGYPRTSRDPDLAGLSIALDAVTRAEDASRHLSTAKPVVSHEGEGSDWAPPA